MPVIGVVFAGGSGPVLVSALASVAAVVVRYRRAAGDRAPADPLAGMGGGDRVAILILVVRTLHPSVSIVSRLRVHGFFAVDRDRHATRDPDTPCFATACTTSTVVQEDGDVLVVALSAGRSRIWHSWRSRRRQPVPARLRGRAGRTHLPAGAPGTLVRSPTASCTAAAPPRPRCSASSRSGCRRPTPPTTSCRGWRRSSKERPTRSEARRVAPRRDLTARAGFMAPRAPVTPAVTAVARRCPCSRATFAAEVRHRGELLGAITASFHANDPIDPGRERLIRDMAAQAGLVLRNVRLIEELARVAPADGRGPGRGPAAPGTQHPRRRATAAGGALGQDPTRRHVDRPRHREGARDAGADPGGHERCARDPARPRTGDLPAAARRQGTGGGAGRAGTQGRRCR